MGALSEVVGGRLGRHAGVHPWWTPVRVLLLVTAAVMALGMVQKAGCYADEWTDGESRYAQMCYSDLPYLYTGRGFAELAWPYSDDPGIRARYQVMEYPVGISYLAWGAAAATHALSGSPDLDARFAIPPDDLFGDDGIRREAVLFTAVNAVWLAAAALAATFFLAGTHRRRTPGGPRAPASTGDSGDRGGRAYGWDAMAFAASPALLLTGIVNWDLYAVALVAAALWAWSRDRPVLTGVLIGLGTATKLYPLFLLGGVLVLCVRERRWLDLLRCTLAGLAAWWLVNLPAYVANPDAWRVFWGFNSDRGPDLGSIWLVLRDVSGADISAHTVNVWSFGFFAVCCVAIGVLGLLAPSPPRLAQLGFLVVLAFLLVNKVYSPQYVLWLLPLAVLARPRWRDQLVWQGAEILYFASVWWYLGGFLNPGGDGGPGFYWLIIGLRLAVELWFAALVVRDVLRPDLDPRGELRPPARRRPGSGGRSGDLDVVEAGRREADPDVELVADGGHGRA